MLFVICCSYGKLDDYVWLEDAKIPKSKTVSQKSALLPRHPLLVSLRN
jgi:hypothetical protein